MTNKLKEARKELKKKDKEWAVAIKKKFNNKCIICGATERLNAHHIIPRQIKQFRHDLRNGMALCPKHHRFSFELSAHQNPIVFYNWIRDNNPKLKEEVDEMIKGVVWIK